MPQKKPPNLNTKYGRRRWREEGRQAYEAKTPSEKREANLQGVIILIVIMVIMFLLLGPSGFLKWASH